MVIKDSTAAEVRTLIEALKSSDAIAREAAIARLAIIGPRAVDRLLGSYRGTSDRSTHAAILRALEAIGDGRAAPVARRALAEGRDVGVEAAGVLRALLQSTHDEVATGALDALVEVALDRGADRRVRLAAFDALQDTPEDVRTRVAEALRAEPDDILRTRAESSSDTRATADAIWVEALAGRLPEDPRALHEMVSARAADAPLADLRRLIETLRDHERGTPNASDWTAVRGSVHQALALRGSRVALYDLRETIERADAALPASFLAALQAIGDPASLEAIAAAWSRAAADDRRWREQLGVAFRAIARREKITRRHAVMKRLTARWPAAQELA
jgi:hypothetical protein